MKIYYKGHKKMAHPYIYMQKRFQKVYCFVVTREFEIQISFFL